MVRCVLGSANASGGSCRPAREAPDSRPSAGSRRIANPVSGSGFRSGARFPGGHPARPPARSARRFDILEHGSLERPKPRRDRHPVLAALADRAADHGADLASSAIASSMKARRCASASNLSAVARVSADSGVIVALPHICTRSPGHIVASVDANARAFEQRGQGSDTVARTASRLAENQFVACTTWTSRGPVRRQAA